MFQIAHVKLRHANLSPQKNSSGRGGLCFFLSVPFREPGIRNCPFFVYTFKSNIGFSCIGHHMRRAMIVFHTFCLTKGLMHPCALCSRIKLVYICQLLYQRMPSFGDGRHRLSIWKEHGLGRQALMAFFRIRSVPSVVGSSAVVAEYD